MLSRFFDSKESEFNCIAFHLHSKWKIETTYKNVYTHQYWSIHAGPLSLKLFTSECASVSEWYLWWWWFSWWKLIKYSKFKWLAWIGPNGDWLDADIGQTNCSELFYTNGIRLRHTMKWMLWLHTHIQWMHFGSSKDFHTNNAKRAHSNAMAQMTRLWMRRLVFGKIETNENG